MLSKAIKGKSGADALILDLEVRRRAPGREHVPRLMYQYGYPRTR